MMRRATYRDLQEILHSNMTLLRRKIGNDRAQLSIPVDGRGLRILVETGEGEANKVPPTVRIKVHGEVIGVNLEAREAAQVYEALDAKVA